LSTLQAAEAAGGCYHHWSAKPARTSWVPVAAGTDAKRWSATAGSGADKLPLAPLKLTLADRDLGREKTPKSAENACQKTALDAKRQIPYSRRLTSRFERRVMMGGAGWGIKLAELSTWMGLHLGIPRRRDSCGPRSV
jgi:hypothetical protein